MGSGVERAVWLNPRSTADRPIRSTVTIAHTLMIATPGTSTLPPLGSAFKQPGNANTSDQITTGHQQHGARSALAMLHETWEQAHLCAVRE